MNEILTNPASWVLVLMLIGLLWYKERHDRKEAFRKGASLGFMLGMDRTLGILSTKGMVRDSEDQPMSKEQMILAIGPAIVEDVVKETKRMSDAR